MSELSGLVALVTNAGTGEGSAIALSLAARGVSVVVAGPEERRLGELVGEIACAAGKARHVVGDAADPADVAAFVGKAQEAFGALHIVVADLGVAEQVFRTAVPQMAPPGRLVVITPERDTSSLELVASLAREVARADLTCNAVVVAPGEGDDLEAAARVAFLCSPRAEGLTGEVLAGT